MKASFLRRKILPLPAAVAGRIAAGEVVERPVSIVKELIENSIDSGADSIVLEIKNGGKSYIRVSDNGCGIPQDQVETAFLRHATSKIQDDKDLLSIETLGFRGEALASICAVTRTTMITKTPDEPYGLKISFEGGKVVEKAPVGAADGTTIIVSDLFFNTPVREKFMKKDSTESAMVGDYISRMSLAYPFVRFRFISNEKTVFSTDGKGSILENIFRIYGKDVGKNLIEVGENKNGIEMNAYISNPLFTKNSRKSQYFFVNGRAVYNKVLEEGLARGYGNKVPEGRFPVAFVFVKLSSDRVDVNIHPNKKEIRFDNPDEIRGLIENAVFEALDSREAVGNMSDIIEPKSDDNTNPTFFASGSGASGGSGTKEKNPFRFTVKTHNNADKVSEDKESWQTVLQTTFGNKSGEKREDREWFTGGPKSEETTIEAGAVKKDPDSGIKDSENYIETPDEAFDIASLRVLGVLFDTYIAASDYKTFYLIDQHAAHERVFYEKFLKEFYRKTAATQTVLTPIIKDIPYYAAEGENTWMGFLKKCGFDLEPFGENAYIFRGIPAYMDFTQAKLFLDDYVDNISTSVDFRDKITVDKIIMRSCKAAVKAHDRLSSEEIRALLHDLSKCKNPYSCPHGRPTIVKMTENDMKKLFKRV